MKSFRKSCYSALCILAVGCTSGPFKINQSGNIAEVIDDRPQHPVKQAAFRVLIIPSGAVQTTYLSDKTSALGGIVGSMVISPIAGLAGSIAGSTAGSAASAHAEEAASRNIDSQDISQAIRPANLPVYFSEKLSEQLKNCGIESSVYTQTLEPTRINWADTHLNLPSGFATSLSPYRFFLQAGVTQIKLRSGLKDDTLEGNAFVRVYESRSLKQMGRYSYSTGTTGSVTLHHYSRTSPQQSAELAQAAKAVSQYLASGIANDMCSIMQNF